MLPLIFFMGLWNGGGGEIHTLSAALIFRVSVKNSIQSGILGILSMSSFRYRSFDTAHPDSFAKKAAALF